MRLPTKTLSSRRGLAPLELCLVLPVLLFVAALLIHAGTSFVWQVRGLNVSRDRAWQQRSPRGGAVPNPVSWPEPGTISQPASDTFDLLDLPQLAHAVARGPLPGARVNEELLDPSRHPIAGAAGMTRTPQIPPRGMRVRFDLRHDLLQNTWTYRQFGMGGNVEQRVPVIYELAKADPALVERYIEAVKAIYYAPFAEDLYPLDREPDFPRFGRGSPDFHPRLGNFSSIDVERVRQQQVGPLLERIEDLPRTMGRAFLGLYRGALADLEQQLDADPPPSPAEAAAIQAELTALHGELDPLIEQLEDFLAGLDDT